MLDSLVRSADHEMIVRAHKIIRSITDKMAVDVANFCKEFTQKAPAKKSVRSFEWRH